MKLNKKQIETLAKKFYNEAIEVYNKQKLEEKLKQLEKYKPLYDKGIAVLNKNNFLASINISIPGKDSFEALLKRDFTFEEFISNYNFNYLVKSKLKSFSLNDIINDIVLATIDSSSVEDMMNTLKNKYK